MSLVTRFAPSPTGPLHLGHARSALLAHDVARAARGQFLLRIEDIDRQRCRPEHEGGILEDLAWLGLTWDGPVRRQSEHFDFYAAALEKLRALGVLYRCFRTRRELAEASASAPHDGGHAEAAAQIGPLLEHEERERLAKGDAYAWRLSMSCSQALLGEEFARLAFEEHGAGPNGERGRIIARPELCGDVILARKDTPVSYHLAVVTDDALQGVTDVVRGEDLFAATHVHVLLQRLLGLPTPVYRHHPLLCGPDGRRLSKRDGAVSLASLRAQGLSTDDVRKSAGVAG